MHDPDETVIIRPPRRRRTMLFGALAAIACAALAGGLALLPTAPAPQTPPAIPAPRGAPVQPAPALPPLMAEAAILDRAPAATEVYRFAQRPAVIVLQFASLADQASTLNRVAAFVEKAGFPRDRVVADAELDRGIRAGGDVPETFYLGHDYRAADLLRFFAAADAAFVALTEQERWLRQSMPDWGWRSPDAGGALISLAAAAPAAGLDQAARAAILRHELSHGEYFTQPAYAAWSRQFWNGVLTEEERERFRTFLGVEGYDVTLGDLMINETQAFLVHTHDPRFFNATSVGIAQERLDSLRGTFVAGMPPGWLRDATPVPRCPFRGRRRERRHAAGQGPAGTRRRRAAGAP